MSRSPQQLSPGNTVRLETHAADTLSYIRATMESAGSLAVPGTVGLSSGAIGLCAALLASLPALHASWLVIWLAAAVLAATVGSVLLLQRSARGSWTFSGAPLRRFAACLLPSLAAGAVMTALHWRRGDLQVVPGTWLILYGCGLIAAGAAAARRLAVLGTAFFALGLLALCLPDDWQMAALGAGFGGLHVAFGVLSRRIYRDR